MSKMSITRLVIIIAGCLCVPGAVAQTVYRPSILIKPRSSTVKFNYGTGTFTCSRFRIATLKSTVQSGLSKGAVRYVLNVDIFCRDTKANLEISINNNKNNSEYNVSTSAWLASKPAQAGNLPAVLVCDGECKSSFRSIRIGNLIGTRVRPWNPKTTKFSCFDTPISTSECTRLPLEVSIIRENGASAIKFRVGFWKKFEEARGLFADVTDPNGPRASRSVGGRTSSSDDLAVEASGN